MLNGVTHDIKDISFRNKDFGGLYVMSVLLDLLNQNKDGEHVIGQDVHNFSAQNRALLAKGLEYLREQTPDIAFRRSYREAGIDVEATKEACDQFYVEHLKPALEALLKDLDTWQIKVSKKHTADDPELAAKLQAAIDARDKDREVLRGYLAKLIEEYKNSSKDSAAEEIVRYYAWKKADADSDAVFALYDVFIECFYAYEGNSASCKPGIMERIRRDAGLFALSLADDGASISLENYYGTMLEGFLDEEGNPGRYLLQLAALYVLEEFETLDHMGESINHLEMRLLDKLWPKITEGLEEYAQVQGLPWVVARFTDVDQVKEALLKSLLIHLEGIYGGIAEAKEDLEVTVLMGCFSRAAKTADLEAVLAQASKILGKKVKMDELKRSELLNLRKIEMAVEARKAGSHRALADVMEEVRLKMKVSKLPWDEGEFISLQVPCYDIRKRCYEYQSQAAMLKSLLPNTPLDQVISCLLPRHITDEMLGDIEARLHTDHDNALDTVVSVIEKLIELKEERALELFSQVVSGLYKSGELPLDPKLPDQIMGLYHNHASLREAFKEKVEARALKERIELAIMLNDSVWLEDLIKDIPVSVFEDIDGEYTELVIVSPMIARSLLKRDGVQDAENRDTLLMLAMYAKDEKAVKQWIERHTVEEIKESEALFNILYMADVSRLCLSDEAVELYCQKMGIVNLDGVYAGLCQLMLSGHGPMALLSRCSDEQLEKFASIEEYDNYRSLLEVVTTGKGPQNLTRAQKIQWMMEIVKRTKVSHIDLDYAISSQHVEPEILLAILEKISTQEDKPGINEYVWLIGQALDANRPLPFIWKIMETQSDVLSHAERSMFVKFFAREMNVEKRQALIDRWFEENSKGERKNYKDFCVALCESIKDKALLKYLLKHKGMNNDILQELFIASVEAWGGKLVLAHCSTKTLEGVKPVKLINMASVVLESSLDREDFEKAVELLGIKTFFAAIVRYGLESNDTEQNVWFIECLRPDNVEDTENTREALIDIIGAVRGSYLGRASLLAAELFIQKWPDRIITDNVLDELMFHHDLGSCPETVSVLANYVITRGRADMVMEMLPNLFCHNMYSSVVEDLLSKLDLKLTEVSVRKVIENNFSDDCIIMVLDKVGDSLSAEVEGLATDKECSEAVIEKIKSLSGKGFFHS